MSARKIVFIRHGEPQGAEGRCIGHTDIALSQDGIHAMRALATELTSIAPISNGDTTRIVSSDLRRASDSAYILASSLHLPLEIDNRLREMNFGEWDGRRWSAIEADDGDRLRAWSGNWVDLAAPSGESLTDVALRADAWINSQPDQTAPETVFVVSHAGWIRAALCALLDFPLNRCFEFPVDYARSTVLSMGSFGARIIAQNASSPCVPLR